MQKMRVYFLSLLICCISVDCTVAAATSRYASGVEILRNSHQYIQDHTASTYWKISPYYISQRNATSCSLASAVMIVNAARRAEQLTPDQHLATQDELLQRVKSEEWIKWVAPDGEGVTLEQLGALMAKALQAYGKHNFTIKVVHLKNDAKENAAILHKYLVENEKTGQTFMIANFDLKFFVESINVGHFAPVGAYDEQAKRVLIMDPYRTLYEPYWVPEKLFLQSMATIDKEANAYRGYLLVAL